MASLRFIKTLKNSQPTMLQLLNSLVFGNTSVKPYSEVNIYHEGDPILVYNNNRPEILYATRDGITGPFVSADWTRNNLSDLASGKTSNTKLIQMKDIQPADSGNVIWYEPLNYVEGDPKVSAVQHIKLEDGSFITLMPINTAEQVYIDLNSKLSLSHQVETTVQDMISIVYKLSAFLDKPLILNHIYVDDLNDENTISITSGAFTPGQLFI